MNVTATFSFSADLRTGLQTFELSPRFACMREKGFYWPRGQAPEIKIEWQL